MTRVADHAPMVITRLSGWINVGEGQAYARACIITTAGMRADRKSFLPK